MRGDEFIREIKKFCVFFARPRRKGKINLLELCAPCVFAVNDFLFRLVRVRPSK